MTGFGLEFYPLGGDPKASAAAKVHLMLTYSLHCEAALARLSRMYMRALCTSGRAAHEDGKHR